VGSRSGTELRGSRKSCGNDPRPFLALSCSERPVFAQKRQGVSKLKLAGGETVWVAPEYITREPVGSAEPPEDDPAVVLDDQDLGSEFEDEDPVPQDEQDWGEADSVRHVRGRYEWERTYIREEQRYLNGHTTPFYSHMRQVDQTLTDRPWVFFRAFVPLVALDEALAKMVGIGRRAWPDFLLNRHLWFVWLGTWFRMCADKLRDRDMFWSEGVATAHWYRETMPLVIFKRIHSVLSVAQYDLLEQRKVDEVGVGPDKFQWFRKWLHAVSDQFKLAWVPGTYLVPDETMVFWTGLGPVHLTYIPRKPSPLGVMFKVTCCGESGVLLHAELVDGADVDKHKKHVERHKATTACTLRLTEHWQSSGRIVVGDAWFGSVRTVEELLGIGLYSIMCVKQGSAGFPKDLVKGHMNREGIRCSTRPGPCTLMMGL